MMPRLILEELLTHSSPESIICTSVLNPSNTLGVFGTYGPSDDPFSRPRDLRPLEPLGLTYHHQKTSFHPY
jgi:hypothetical protein